MFYSTPVTPELMMHFMNGLHNQHFLNCQMKLPFEKEMATHSSIFAWKIPQTEEPGRLHSMGSQRIRHDGATEHPYTHLPQNS